MVVLLYRVLGNHVWVLNNQVKFIQRRIALVDARRTRERPRPSGSKKNKVAKHKRILFESKC